MPKLTKRTMYIVYICKLYIGALSYYVTRHVTMRMPCVHFVSFRIFLFYTTFITQLENALFFCISNVFAQQLHLTITQTTKRHCVTFSVSTFQTQNFVYLNISPIPVIKILIPTTLINIRKISLWLFNSSNSLYHFSHKCRRPTHWTNKRPPRFCEKAHLCL